jgi:hypothetical protein
MRLAIALLIALLGCGSGGGPTLPCNTSITSYCTQNNCTYPPQPAFGCAHTHVDMNCGPYISVTDMGVDTGSISYYDRSTGALVAVTDYSANFGGHTTCVAGPSGGFVVPQCTGPSMDLCDAGTD